MECSLCFKKLNLITDTKTHAVKSDKGITYCIECYDVHDWAFTTSKTETPKTTQDLIKITDTKKVVPKQSTNYVKVYCSKCKVHFEESKCLKCGFKNPLFR